MNGATATSSLSVPSWREWSGTERGVASSMPPSWDAGLLSFDFVRHQFRDTERRSRGIRVWLKNGTWARCAQHWSLLQFTFFRRYERCNDSRSTTRLY